MSICSERLTAWGMFTSSIGSSADDDSENCAFFTPDTLQFESYGEGDGQFSDRFEVSVGFARIQID